MAVDLADLIPSLERETSPPGTDLFPDATDDEWLGQLTDSFWEAKLFNFFAGFTASEDGLVNPISGSEDMSRTDQQLVVLFAGIRSIRLKLMNTNTSFRAVAGPVEFETQNSANLLVEILKELQAKIAVLYATLGGLGTTQTYYLNAVMERTDSILSGLEGVWGGSGGPWTSVYTF